MKKLDRTIFQVIILCCLFSCQEPLPQIGEQVDFDKTSAIKEKRLLTPNGNLVPYRTLKYAGISYNLVTDDNDRLIFISTSDTAFTNAAYSVGSTIDELDNREYTSIQGWADFVALDEGWYAAFSKDTSNQAARISFFFRMI